MSCVTGHDAETVQRIIFFISQFCPIEVRHLTTVFVILQQYVVGLTCEILECEVFLSCQFAIT